MGPKTAQKKGKAELKATTMLQEIEDELRKQQDAEEAASLIRDSECLRQREMQNEVDEWEALLNPSHLPDVHDEADLPPDESPAPKFV
jgi:hypothetical protein